MDVGTAQDLCAAGRSSPTGAIPCTACAAGRLVVEMSSCVAISPLYNNNGIIKRQKIYFNEMHTSIVVCILFGIVAFCDKMK